MGIFQSGRPSASACASSSSTRTACIATRCAGSLIVVSRAATSTTSPLTPAAPRLDRETIVFIRTSSFERAGMEQAGEFPGCRRDARPGDDEIVAEDEKDAVV